MNFGPIMQNQNMEKRQQRFRSEEKHIYLLKKLTRLH